MLKQLQDGVYWSLLTLFVGSNLNYLALQTTRQRLGMIAGEN